MLKPIFVNKVELTLIVANDRYGRAAVELTGHNKALIKCYKTNGTDNVGNNNPITDFEIEVCLSGKDATDMKTDIFSLIDGEFINVYGGLSHKRHISLDGIESKCLVIVAEKISSPEMYDSETKCQEEEFFNWTDWEV